MSRLKVSLLDVGSYRFGVIEHLNLDILEIIDGEKVHRILNYIFNYVSKTQELTCFSCKQRICNVHELGFLKIHIHNNLIEVQLVLCRDCVIKQVKNLTSLICYLC